MNCKEEYRNLVERVKRAAKLKGEKLRNEDIATRLGITRTYLSDLVGVPGKEVTNKHIEDFKAHFRQELSGAYTPKINDEMNPERALYLAMLQDYTEWKAEVTGQPFETVKAGLKKKASLILTDLHSWLPDQK